MEPNVNEIEVLLGEAAYVNGKMYKRGDVVKISPEIEAAWITARIKFDRTQKPQAAMELPNIKLS